MMNARDRERAASELARPRSLSSARRLTSGLTVGASTVSPSPNSAVKPNTKAIRPMAAAGRAQRNLDVSEHLCGLVGDVVADQLASLRVGAALTGQEDPVAGQQAGRVGPAATGTPGRVMSSVMTAVPLVASRGRAV